VRALELGQWASALDESHALLYPTPRVQGKTRLRAREVLGTAYWKLDAPEAARREWGYILMTDLKYAPTAVARISGAANEFEALRQRFAANVQTAGPVRDGRPPTVPVRLFGQWGCGLMFEGLRYPSGDTGSLALESGEYTVTVVPTVAGALAREHRFEVRDGMPPQQLRFAPGWEDARMKVLTTEPAEVTAAGRRFESGETVVFKVRRPREAILLTISAPGHTRVVRRVTLVAGSELEVTINLDQHP
jgi:hypothetical protein